MCLTGSHAGLGNLSAPVPQVLGFMGTAVQKTTMPGEVHFRGKILWAVVNNYPVILVLQQRNTPCVFFRGYVSVEPFGLPQV